MSTELTAPVLHKNKAKRFVMGPVLLPGEPDSDGDVVSAEQIERVAHNFMEQYQNIDLQHSLNNVGKVLETYIAPQDLEVNGFVIPQGTWVMGVKVTDDDTWEKVVSGELTGFSIMGIPTAMKSATSKRTTLADLGEEWVVNAVSLVDEPAVPKAKWIVMKSKGKVIKAIEGSHEHRREVLEQKLVDLFPRWEDRPYVYQLFDDHVVLVNWHEDGDQYIDVPYLYEDNDITFTGEPTPITIEEVAKPKEDSEPEEPIKESFWQRVGKALGFNKAEPEEVTPATKAGRTISEANFQKLVEAQGLLNDLVSTAESERATKAQAKEVDLDMSPEELKQLIKDTVQELEDEKQDNPENVEDEPKDEDKQDEPKDEGASEDSKDDEPEEDEDKKVIKSLMERIEVLEKSRPHSKRLFGQDGAATKSASNQPVSDRDAFGRKIK